jgi:hypothetical protein
VDSSVAQLVCARPTPDGVKILAQPHAACPSNCQPRVKWGCLLQAGNCYRTDSGGLTPLNEIDSLRMRASPVEDFLTARHPGKTG